MLTTLLLLLNALVAIALVGVILLQRSDSGLGGAFGGGPNAGMGMANRNPLAKITSYLAVIFMGSSLVLAVISQGGGADVSVAEGFDQLEQPEQSTQPTQVPVMEGDTNPVPEIPSIPVPPQP